MESGSSSEQSNAKLGDYLRLLTHNKYYRTLFFSELVDDIGNWFHLIATIEVAKRLSGSSGLTLSGIFFVRVAPNFLLFPVTGAVSDTFDRGRVMLYSSIVNMAVALLFPLLTNRRQLPWLYILLFAQFTGGAFYTPARRAIAPSLVLPEEQTLQGTLDGVVWSIICGVGSSLGGFAVSAFGTSTCFVIDAATFAVAGLCSWYLIGQPKKHPDTKQPVKGDIESNDRTCSLEMSVSVDSNSLIHPEDTSTQPTNPNTDHTTQLGTLPADQEYDSDEDVDEGAPLIAHRTAPSVEAASGQDRSGNQPQSKFCWEVVVQGFKDSKEAFCVGWSYIWAKENLHIAAIVTVKAGIGLKDGIGEVMMVRFGNMQSMRSLGDSATTVGLMFGMVGVGCLISPLMFNYFTASKPVPWLRGIVSGFVLITVGCVIMSLAPNIWVLLLSILLGCFGDSVAWIYSTLILQYEVGGEMLGRIVSMELALLAFCEGMSCIFAGVLTDGFKLSTRQSTFVLVGISGMLAIQWAAFTFHYKSRFKT